MTDPAAVDLVISRVADPDATETVTLPGGCRCPGAPHVDGDTATFRTELGAGERNSVRVAGWQATGMDYYDFEAANNALIALAVTDWTLLSDVRCEHIIQIGSKKQPLHGEYEPIPITRKVAALLDEPTRIALLSAIDAAADRYQARLPNASGAPSADSSQESASPNRATRRRASSTRR